MTECKSKYIDMIEQENLREFVAYVIDEYGSDDKLEEANKVCNAMIQLLNQKKLIHPGADARFVDSMVSSAMLHNIFYSEDNPIWVFKARAELLDIGIEEYKVGLGILDAIFQAIEGQLGENSFIPHCRPAPNSPTEIFATAIWIVKDYKTEY